MTPFLRSNKTYYFYIDIFYHFLENYIETELADAKDAGNDIKITFNEK